MKNYIKLIILTGLSFSLIQYPVFSQSPTPTVEVTKPVDKEIQELKDKVADKVDELKDQKKQAISGIIEDIEGDTISLLNSLSEKVKVDIDDTLTSFYEIVGTNIKDISIKDIAKGNYIFVTGPAIGETVTANSVYKDKQYSVFSGKIIDVNREDFTIKIITVDKSKYILDIEKSTKQSILDIKTLQMNKIGFSKLKEGDSVHCIYEGDVKNSGKTQFTAVKLLVIPNEFFLQ